MEVAAAGVTKNLITKPAANGMGSEKESLTVCDPLSEVVGLTNPVVYTVIPFICMITGPSNVAVALGTVNLLWMSMYSMNRFLPAVTVYVRII